MTRDEIADLRKRTFDYVAVCGMELLNGSKCDDAAMTSLLAALQIHRACCYELEPIYSAGLAVDERKELNEIRLRLGRLLHEAGLTHGPFGVVLEDLAVMVARGGVS